MIRREDWARLLRVLSTDHGISPIEVGRMTREQLIMIACERPERLLATAADNLT